MSLLVLQSCYHFSNSRTCRILSSSNVTTIVDALYSVALSARVYVLWQREWMRIERNGNQNRAERDYPSNGTKQEVRRTQMNWSRMNNTWILYGNGHSIAQTRNKKIFTLPYSIFRYESVFVQIISEQRDYEDESICTWKLSLRIRTFTLSIHLNRTDCCMECWTPF